MLFGALSLLPSWCAPFCLSSALLVSDGQGQDGSNVAGSDATEPPIANGTTTAGSSGSSTGPTSSGGTVRFQIDPSTSTGQHHDDSERDRSASTSLASVALQMQDGDKDGKNEEEGVEMVPASAALFTSPSSSSPAVGLTPVPERRGSKKLARSLSHWNDSQISVEMHLELYIGDLMMLAPELATEKEQATAGPSDVVPVEFDEDAEPDVTLPHVLAGIEYLLHTRIIGNANTQADADTKHPIVEEEVEEDEEEEEEEEDDEKKDDRVTDGMPAALAAAPAQVVEKAVTSIAAPIKPASSSPAAPYFYFVSLNLQICDDLVTALCFHMRRAEQRWSIRPRPSAEAKKALQLFEGFFIYVYSFRCCVAARAVSYLKASLKVSRHLRDADPNHRKLIVRLLLLIVHECPRIASWEDLVESDEHAKVRSIVNSPEMRRLQRQLDGAQRHMDREMSMSRQASFLGSRAEIAGLVSVVPVGDVAASFPAFFSQRHNTLLPPKSAYFDVEPHRLVYMFRTNTKVGLSTEEVEERQRMYGKNELPPPKEPSIVVMLWNQLKDFIILIMLAACVVSMAIQDWESAGVLFAVVLINVVIGMVQEIRSGRALKALSSFSIPQAQVLRNGVTSVEAASELVPGDIVVLDEGANVPADLRMVEVSQLATVEAILTGESLPISKSTAAIKPRGRRYLTVGDRTNMAFMSTLVNKGRGIGVVVNTGATTEVGRIYAALTADDSTPLTPLQRKLARLGKWLVLISIVSCALVIGVGLGQGYGEAIIKVGVSLAVSVIPEGLVTVVTLTMAVGVQRMAACKAIVRNLPAVETLGAVTTICSDKTGTLTEGRMKTSRMWAFNGLAGGAGDSSDKSAAYGNTIRFLTSAKIINEGSNSSSPSPVMPASPSDMSASSAPSSKAEPTVTAMLDGEKRLATASDLPTPLHLTNLVCSLNNNATMKMNEVVDDKGETHLEEQWVGDATEIALFRAAQQCHCDLPYWHSNYGLSRVLEFAFDSDRKRMSVVVTLPPMDANNTTFLNVERPADATHILLVKGAPEAVLNKSIHVLRQQGGKASPTYALQPMQDDIDEAIEHEGSAMAGDGMRVLAAAFRFLTQTQVDKMQADLAAAAKQAEEAASKPLDVKPSGAEPSMLLDEIACMEAEDQLCFIGLAGIMDPPRVEVKDAIIKAHGAGIRVCMITGDHYETALAIAKQIGIYSESRGDRAMNGDALAVLSEEQLAALDPFPVVFSRVSPDNKLKLVKALQKRGEIAAMTGDGVNDSPAIKQADVGIAMGLAGTEVTRQAADIVLSDDNFTTIVLAVEEGRRIVDNIIKFLVYLLTCNGSEVLIMLISVCAHWDVPFLPLMLLWANIFVDVPPSLALGLDKVDDEAMQRKPRPDSAAILPLELIAVMTIDSLCITFIVLFNYRYMIDIRGEELGYARSLAFLTLAVIHLLNAWVASSLTETMFRRDIASNNPAMVYSVFVATAVIVAGHYIPGLNHTLELEPIRGPEWGQLFISLAVFICLVEFRKFVMRRMKARKKLKEEMIAINEEPAPGHRPVLESIVAK